MKRAAVALSLAIPLVASCSRADSKQAESKPDRAAPGQVVVAGSHDRGAPDPRADAQVAPDPRAGAQPWEDAVATCAPGSSFEVCVHALDVAGVKLRKVDRADYREVTFDLQRPFGGVGVRTYPKADGRIVDASFTMYLDQGAPRRDLVRWMAKQLGPQAKQVRAGNARGAAADCGEDGWGVGWAGSASSEPEVELELTSPESQSANDEPDKLEPEDALVKRQGNGLVGACFVLPPKNGSPEFITTPDFSVAAMKAYLSSPWWHGVARLK